MDSLGGIRAVLDGLAGIGAGLDGLSDLLERLMVKSKYLAVWC